MTLIIEIVLLNENHGHSDDCVKSVQQSLTARTRMNMTFLTLRRGGGRVNCEQKCLTFFFMQLGCLFFRLIFWPKLSNSWGTTIIYIPSLRKLISIKTAIIFTKTYKTFLVKTSLFDVWYHTPMNITECRIISNTSYYEQKVIRKASFCIVLIAVIIQHWKMLGKQTFYSCIMTVGKSSTASSFQYDKKWSFSCYFS